MLDRLYAVIDSARADLRELSDSVWSHPECAYKEFFAVESVKKFMCRYGFEMVQSYCGIETAFYVEYSNGDGPVFAIAAEYDALPVIGHGCGHNLICAAGCAAFIAVARIMKEENINGKVILFGTPGEEGGGGKVKMVEAGCLEGVDAVIMVHPSGATLGDPGSTANIGLEVIFHGKSAHAAASPEKGINALDAVNLVFAGVNTYRQYVPEFVRMHGVITDGGQVPNVIPDYARCTFYLRSAREEWCPILEQRFRDIVKGAELMTGATAEINHFRPYYRARKPNKVMNAEYVKCMSGYGLKIKIPETGGRGSSDFGNFSQVIPGIHAYFAASPVEGLPVHTIEFSEAAKTDYAFENMLKAASAQANIVCRFMVEKDFRDAVKKDFELNK